MKETKHTPGPWATNGLIVTAPVFPSMLVVCTLSTTAPSGNTRYDPEMHGDELRANATLIAAAPEMRELLEEIARVPYRDSDCRSLCETYAVRAQALLDKVRGVDGEAA